MTKKAKWEGFCSSWVSVGSCATVDANRRISAEGHMAMMEMLARTGGRL